MKKRLIKDMANLINKTEIGNEKHKRNIFELVSTLSIQEIRALDSEIRLILQNLKANGLHDKIASSKYDWILHNYSVKIFEYLNRLLLQMDEYEPSAEFLQKLYAKGS